MLSIILPAMNEAAHIDACLAAVLASEGVRAQVVVAANGCTDDTVRRAQSWAARFADAGWSLVVIDRQEPGKPAALNAGDAAATGAARIYLDADVVVSPSLLKQIEVALDTDAPRYASGRLVMAPARSAVTRAYARFWSRVPFMAEGVPGAGLFAVNAAGRARWEAFPDVISDDTFVRLQFAPQERVRVPASYLWPVVEGASALLRVRRRQNVGVTEISNTYPELMARSSPSLSGAAALRRAASDPLGFAVYSGINLLARLTARRAQGWSRGR